MSLTRLGACKEELHFFGLTTQILPNLGDGAAASLCILPVHGDIAGTVVL